MLTNYTRVVPFLVCGRDMPKQGDRDFGMAGTRRGRHLFGLMSAVALVVVFFALYTDFFARPLPLWASMVHWIALALVFGTVLLLVFVPSLVDEWAGYRVVLRQRLTRGDIMALYAVEIASLVAFLSAYAFLRNPDGSRPFLYDLAVGAYVLVIGLILLTIWRLVGET